MRVFISFLKCILKPLTPGILSPSSIDNDNNSSSSSRRRNDSSPLFDPWPSCPSWHGTHAKMAARCCNWQHAYVHLATATCRETQPFRRHRTDHPPHFSFFSFLFLFFLFYFLFPFSLLGSLQRLPLCGETAGNASVLSPFLFFYHSREDRSFLSMYQEIRNVKWKEDNRVSH